MTANELIEKYPNILKTYPSCGNGWYWLLDNLLQFLKFNIEYNDHPNIEITDIKEKYGRLNLHVFGSSTEQHSVISFVEHLSFHTCEECGTTKNIGHTTPWVKTLCETCYNNSTFSNQHSTLFL